MGAGHDPEKGINWIQSEAAAVVGHGAEVLGERAQLGCLERAARGHLRLDRRERGFEVRGLQGAARTSSRAKRRFGRSYAS